MVARRTNKKEKTAILIAALYKKHYFAHEYLLRGKLVGKDLLRYFIFYCSHMNLN